MSERKVKKTRPSYLFSSILPILPLVYGYYRRHCLEQFYSQTHIPALEITDCGLLKGVVYRWNRKPLKPVLYRPDMLVFLIIVIYLRKGKKCWRRQVAALAGPASGPCCVWILLRTSPPRPWCGNRGETCGERVAEPSLQSATTPGWQIDLDVVDGWQWSEQSWDVAPGLWLAPGPWQLWQTRPCRVFLAKHEGKKLSTIMQVKKGDGQRRNCCVGGVYVT